MKPDCESIPKPGDETCVSLQLLSEHVAIIQAILDRHLPHCEVRVFGSRAQGKARPFSDVDLLVLKPEYLSLNERINLVDAFEESDLPYCVDLLEFSKAPLAWKNEVLQASHPLLATGQTDRVGNGYA